MQLDGRTPAGRRASVILCALAALTAITFACTGRAPSRPNIVFILVDDLGWNDVGYHESVIRTPAIDELAQEGVRLEQFYGGPTCTPARASLMTGRYPMRMGLQEIVLRPWTHYGLPLNERTLAQALHEAGYRTEMVGKWHLGHGADEYLPHRRGFEHHYGSYTGFVDYFSHEREGLDWHRDGQDVREEGHTTTLIADEAVRIVSGHAGERPLFLYVAFHAPHAPPRPPVECRDLYPELQPDERGDYAAQVTCLDSAIGRIVDAIDARGLARDTLVIFQSDNGGNGKLGDNHPLRGKKGKLYEGGVRVATVIRWTDHLPPGRVDEPLHMVDWFPTLVKIGGGRVDGPLALDGCDAWPAIAERAESPHREILLGCDPERGAIRAGRWKLVVDAHWPGNADLAIDVTAAELFDLESDPTERENLAGEREEEFRSLLGSLARYALEAVPPRGGLPDNDALGSRSTDSLGDDD